MTHNLHANKKKTMTLEEYGIFMKEHYSSKEQKTRIRKTVDSVQTIINNRDRDGFKYSEIGKGVARFVDINDDMVPTLVKELGKLRVNGRKVKVELSDTAQPSHDEILITWN